jgi:hypothetical protein
MFGRGEFQYGIFLSAGIPLPRSEGGFLRKAKQLILCVLLLRSALQFGWLLAQMYLLDVLVKLPLHGSHCCFGISGQSRAAKFKVCVAT